MAELLDHYASLTEQKMETGVSFDDARKRAWAELGASKGLQAIQKDFVKNIQHQVRTQHLDALKSYFRWPTIVTTVLVGLLVYAVVPIISAKWVIISVLIIGLTPALFLLWGYYSGFNNQTNTSQIVWKYMKHKGALSANLIQLSLNLPNVIFENGGQTTRTFLQAYPELSVMICLLTLMYTASFIQLFYRKFHYKIA